VTYEDGCTCHKQIQRASGRYVAPCPVHRAVAGIVACPGCGTLLSPGTCCGGCVADAWAADEDITPYCNPVRP